MKAWYCLPLIAALAACSAPEEGTGAENPAEMADGAFSEDNLPVSEACFADMPSALLEPGQTLIERGPSGMVRVSSALDGETADFAFQIATLSEPHREVIDGAAADFFRAAGDRHDFSTDEVIYHRSRDGTFCAVMRDEAVGQALTAAAASVQAELDTAPAEEVPAGDMAAEDTPQD
ncbi:hypothetical protein [Maricaulis sp.]|uniref:hypothetical protein n=1 Tax=Maricaulis sp. TaxID=1486257 RepID=UPI00262C0FA7|nr:hypothetical protein [Maricaulis sp.]